MQLPASHRPRPLAGDSFDVDKEAAAATRKRRLDRLANDRVPAAGYHMPLPTVGYIDRGGEGCRWVPVTYQLNL